MIKSRKVLLVCIVSLLSIATLAMAQEGAPAEGARGGERGGDRGMGRGMGRGGGVVLSEELWELETKGDTVIVGQDPKIKP